ncbi:O-antigen ligase family protein [Riemerella columbipharyngis]|uniref:O-antigen ligase n=1 Tax=Riemerella columbipharyngis TaxID=1071918 RepID=A0A1G6YW87_9FLAO|nr:O-antigen ligase family protein [Riemerella columbipharyngis]SDD94659.1 O-antigen ligase [Riemerella columbipharyngis]
MLQRWNSFRKVVSIYDITIILMLSGYFLSALTPYFLNTNSINYIERIVVLSLSGYIIFKNKYVKQTYIFYILLLFFILYFLNLCVDFFKYHIVYDKPIYHYFGYLIFISVIPALSIFFIPKEKINWKFILWGTWFSLGIFNVVNILFTDYSNISYRISGITSFWPIIYAQVGVSFSILSVFLYEYLKGKWDIICIVSFYMGLFSCIITGSKGPLFFFFVLLFLYIILFGIPRVFKNVYFIISSILFILFLFFNSDFSIYHRIYDFLFTNNDASKQQRMEILKYTIDSIKEHFWQGSNMFIKTKTLHSTYPHNLFLESIMTMGVIGGILFLFINIKAIYSVFLYLKIKHQEVWVVFLFLQYFFQTFFSLSLYSSEGYWILLAIILSKKIRNNQKYENLNNIRGETSVHKSRIYK